MRTERLGSIGAALFVLAACGGNDEAEVPEMGAGAGPTEVELPGEVVVEAEAAELPPPAHGGTVLAAGDHRVEVVAEEDGYVNAFMLADAPPPPAATEITVRVPADDGEVHPVVLTWNPSENRYRGRLHRVRPVPGPIDVTIVVNGQPHRGRAPRVVVIGPSFAAPAARVEIARPESPQATVHVAPPPGPRVNVEVHHPEPPRAEVRIQPPAPPVPRVEVRAHAPAPPRARVSVRAPAPPPGPRAVVHHPAPPHPAARVKVQHPAGPRVQVRHDNGRRAHGRPARGR